MEQQYTCPFCFKDYTRFTIHEHYGCGVEPLETTEDLNAELEAISEEVAQNICEAEKQNAKFIAEAIPNLYGKPEAPEQLAKPEPKKRGRKPKAK